MVGAGFYLEGCIKKDVYFYDYLKQFVEFVLGMIKVVDRFNEYMFGFEFFLRVGFNVGFVIVGVIGLIKFFYDIWGDIVNIVSRMDLIGVKGRIQVSEVLKKFFDEFFIFERRGIIFVKGKGYIIIYLFIGKRTVCIIVL